MLINRHRTVLFSLLLAVASPELCHSPNHQSNSSPTTTTFREAIKPGPFLAWFAHSLTHHFAGLPGGEGEAENKNPFLQSEHSPGLFSPHGRRRKCINITSLFLVGFVLFLRLDFMQKMWHNNAIAFVCTHIVYRLQYGLKIK